MRTAARAWALGLAVTLLSAALAEPARTQRIPRSGVVLGMLLNTTALWASRDGHGPAGVDAGLGGASGSVSHPSTWPPCSPPSRAPAFPSTVERVQASSDTGTGAYDPTFDRWAAPRGSS